MQKHAKKKKQIYNQETETTIINHDKNIFVCLKMQTKAKAVINQIGVKLKIVELRRLGNFKKKTEIANVTISMSHVVTVSN